MSCISFVELHGQDGQVLGIPDSSRDMREAYTHEMVQFCVTPEIFNKRQTLQSFKSPRLASGLQAKSCYNSLIFCRLCM